MKIKEFVEMYKKNMMIDLNKILKVNPYVSIALKEKAADLILEQCTEKVNGRYYLNSVERYLLFITTVIGLHTNLEFSGEEDEEYSVIEEYDELSKNGLIIKIIDLFREDYEICQEILNMKTADIMQHNETLEQTIYGWLNNLTEILSKTTQEMVDKIDLDKLDISDIDINKFLNIFKESIEA